MTTVTRGRNGRHPGAPRPDRSGAGRSGRTAGSSAQERFEQRVSARRRRTWKLLAVVALLAGLAAGAWWVLWRSDWLLVEKVVVVGTEARWHDEILDAAALAQPQPMVQVDTSAVTAAVTELPIVREVAVLRSWPSTITIKVTPREPVLAVQQGPGRVALVDDEGVTVETVAEPPPEVPVVVSQGSSEGSSGAYRAAWAVVSALPPTLTDQVTEIAVSSAELVTLGIGERTVVWGGPEDAALKAEVAQALLATDAERIDVSAPRSPVTRGTIEPAE